jgi:phosphotransferase system  glucose/maltose/N-acetylglucosamine-specific IIC component
VVFVSIALASQIGFVLMELVKINYGDVQTGLQGLVDFLEMDRWVRGNIQPAVGFFLIISLGLVNQFVKEDL